MKTMDGFGKRPAVGYIRVSTEKQGEVRLERQAALIRDFAAMEGYNLLAIHEDTSSGTQDRRPGALAAIKHCQDEKAVLIMVDQSRLTRGGPGKFRQLANGVDVLTIGEGAHLLTDEEVDMFSTEAQQHAAVVARTTRKALAARKASGRKLGNLDSLEQNRLKGTKSTMNRANERHERLADFLAARPETGAMTVGEIAELLNTSGLLTARGKAWTAAALRRPLKSARGVLAERAELDQDASPARLQPEELMGMQVPGIDMEELDRIMAELDFSDVSTSESDLSPAEVDEINGWCAQNLSE